jgi:hypothetical protein
LGKHLRTEGGHSVASFRRGSIPHHLIVFKTKDYNSVFVCRCD